jgi:hypothetical protein
MPPPVPRSVVSVSTVSDAPCRSHQGARAGLDLLGEVVRVGDDAAHPAAREVVEREGREGAVEHGDEGLGALVGEGAQARAEARAEEHPVRGDRAVMHRPPRARVGDIPSPGGCAGDRSATMYAGQVVSSGTTLQAA